VIYANHDGRTTVTIAADFAGDVSTFGLLIPIPSTVGERDVRIVDPVLFTYLDEYTAPRLVEYESYGDADTDSDSDSDTDADTDTDADVVVEDRFVEGDYDIAVLSTTNASALTDWLGANGFAAPQDRDGILAGYIENGAHFLAAKVMLAAVSSGQTWLPPLQIGYPGSLHGLPIRIGTLSASGSQDLIVYAITDSDDGQVQISNYPQVFVPDECRWDGNDLDAWYQDRLDEAFVGAGWLLEYSIPVVGQANCDPCTTNAPLYLGDLAAYGWGGDATSYDAYYSGGAHLTRLRVRYTAEEADEDLRFAGLGPLPLSQIRYIQDEPSVRDEFPACEDVDVPDPIEPGEDPRSEVRASRACATPGAPVGALAIAAAFTGLVRRRRPRPSSCTPTNRQCL
jgi:hypothetical protein